MTRYISLKLMLKAGQITDLELQPAFPIHIDGEKVTTYKADFAYTTKSGDRVVEDVKGSKNPKHHDPVFKLKSKLVRAAYGIDISIVTS